MSNLGEDGAIERPGNEFLPERGDGNSSPSHQNSIN